MARQFGTTWWGQAWLDALEGIAGGSTGRLGRGRTYARQNRAEDLVIEPGAVRALVQGSQPEPYDVYLQVRAFRDDEWDTVLEAIAAKAGHAAALLDGELDPGVVDDARAVEVDLLPRARDLRTACTCPDDAEPCKHAAAVCYLIADALDADPFVLLLLRGRRRDEVLDGVRQRRSGEDVADTEAEAAPIGVAAVDAWAATPAPLPAVPAVTDRPGRPAAWPSDPPPHAPFTGPGLRSLIADAARRAWELCAGAVDAGLELDERTDLARRSVGAPPVARAEMSERSGVPAVELEALASAWQFGGAAGVRAHDERRWTAPPLEMARARDLIVDAGMPARRVHVSGNRITAEGRLQFRRSRDGTWYLFSKASGRWAMIAPPEPDIDDLLDHDLHH